MTSTMTVTVIIPTFRRLDILQKCLEGTFLLERKPDQVMIVYRPEDDLVTAQWLTEVACQRYPGLELVPVFIPGVVAALNAGLVRAGSDIIAILDDDAIPRPDWLNHVLNHFLRPDVGAVGGRDVVHNHPPVEEVTVAGVRDWWGNIIGNHHRVIGPPREVDVVKGCNWILRRAAIGSLRLDERLLGFGAQVANEQWFCLNLRRAGWKIILAPSAIVDHYPAMKPDYIRTEFSRKKCFESVCNRTASVLAFVPWRLRLRNLVFHLLVGTRECPGLYYSLHALLKRPHALPGIMLGGWAGFSKGWRMAKEFERNPPGYANIPPSR